MKVVKKHARAISLLILLCAYLTAFAVGAVVFVLCPPSFSPVVSSLIANIAATLVIFLFSLGFNNSSFYDPYWSVAPFILAVYWSVNYGNPSSYTDTIILLVILLWSFRLTLNFIRGWGGLLHEDWRYVALRQENPKSYWIINLGGIHLFPTMIVFAAMMPVYVFLHRENISGDYNYIFWGAVLSFTGTLFELIADDELRKHKLQKEQKRIISTGLWKYSRHPNYFGEVIFWWGLWIMMFGVNKQFWWTVTGAFSITLMFVFISIPMIEKKIIQTRPEYKEYQKKVSMLFPWFSKK